MLKFNVYQILKDIVKDVDIYEDVHFPDHIINQDENTKCFYCDTYSKEYVEDEDSNLSCKSCYLEDYYDFNRCDCGTIINPKYGIECQFGDYFCLDCMIKKLENADVPLVCIKCYKELEIKVKERIEKHNKLNFPINDNWEEFIMDNLIWSKTDGLVCTHKN